MLIPAFTLKREIEVGDLVTSLSVLLAFAGLLIAHRGYAATFLVAAAFPALAAVLVPVRDERRPT